MESTQLNKLVFIAVGSLIGTISGYYAAMKILERVRESETKIIHDAFEEVQYAEEKETDLAEEHEKDVASEIIEQEMYHKLTGPQERHLVPGTNKSYVDYGGKSRLTLDKVETMSRKYKEDKNQKVYIVTLEEHEITTYSALSINYYEVDGVFTDQEDNVILNPTDLFGPNIHLNFGVDSGDEDVVFVRNETTSRDYEIIRVHGSYSEIVLGEPPVKKPQKRTKKRKVEDEMKIEEDNPDDYKDKEDRD